MRTRVGQGLWGRGLGGIAKRLGSDSLRSQCFRVVRGDGGGDSVLDVSWGLQADAGLNRQTKTIITSFTTAMQCLAGCTRVNSSIFDYPVSIRVSFKCH